jgi:prepilin-type N-terminal cleavage/methylation domain-containing protein
MQTNRKAKGQRQSFSAGSAFTLVEVLCAIVIGSITLAALFACFSNCYAILRITRDDLRAT